MRNRFIALFAARGFGSVVQALILVLLGRLAGPSSFGAVGVVISTCAVIYALAEFGMATYLSRVRASGDSAEVIAILWINSISSVIFGFAATAVFTILGLSIWAIPIIGLVAAGLGAEKYAEVVLSIPVADGRIRPVFVSLLVRRVSAFIIFVGLAQLIEPTSAYAIGTLAGAAAGVIHARYIVSTAVAKGPKPQRIFPTLHRAWPFFLATFSSQLRYLDATLVGIFASTAAVGLYSAADKLTRPLLLVPQTLTTLVLPRAVKNTHAQSRRDLGRLVGAGLLALVVLLPAVIFSDQILALTLGSAFLSASPTLRIFLLAVPFLAIQSPLGALMQGRGHEHYVAVTSAIFGLLLLVAVTFGAISDGSFGAAIGLLVVTLVRTVSIVVEAFRRLGSTSS